MIPGPQAGSVGAVSVAAAPSHLTQASGSEPDASSLSLESDRAFKLEGSNFKMI